MIDDDDIGERLTTWLVSQMSDVSDLRVDGLDRITFGYSAELLLSTISWNAGEQGHSQDVVIRFRPTPPSLLEPCDLRRQFDILRALESTPVRAPRALWIEESGDILGRPFYVMERVAGEAYESNVPIALSESPELISRMAKQIIEEIATIHLVDLTLTGLDAIDEGRHYLDRELDHWAAEMHRFQRGTLPGLERLLAELRDRRPDDNGYVTLVHGDAKPGNFAFVGGDITGVFDWEMATIGDPLADIGWAEVTWKATPVFANLPPGLMDDLLSHYSELTGFALRDRAWYRAFQTFKMTVIMLVAGMLFDSGHSDDSRMAKMSLGVPHTTAQALAELGISEHIEPGPFKPRVERLQRLGMT